MVRFAAVESALADLELPSGVALLPSAAAESNQQLQESLQLLAGLAVFLVFVVMAVQYKLSGRSPGHFVHDPAGADGRPLWLVRQRNSDWSHRDCRA